MKHSLRTTAIMGALTGYVLLFSAVTTYAANDTVVNAIKKQEDLTSFYEALYNTGVMDELGPHTSYTIFAPVNEAFAAIAYDTYPCFYSRQCRGEVANIVRNHFVVGEVNLKEATSHKGGVYSMDKRFISVAHAGKGKESFMVDGHKVLSTHQLAGGVLYRIDGVIANDVELAVFKQPVLDNGATSQEKVSEKTYYTPAGDIVGKTTTTTTTTETKTVQ